MKAWTLAELSRALLAEYLSAQAPAGEQVAFAETVTEFSALDSSRAHRGGPRVFDAAASAWACVLSDAARGHRPPAAV